jgi:hypothetical protein
MFYDLATASRSNKINMVGSSDLGWDLKFYDFATLFGLNKIPILTTAINHSATSLQPKQHFEVFYGQYPPSFALERGLLLPLYGQYPPSFAKKTQKVSPHFFGLGRPG